MLKRISLLVLALAALAPLGQAVTINGQLQKAGLERLTSDPTGFQGRVYFNTTNNIARIYNGTAWQDVASGGTVDASTQLTGTVPVANGGTGRSTLTANNVILGNGTSAVSFVAPTTQGNVLTATGTTWGSSAPSIRSGSASSPNSERIERARFATCSSGPCSPSTQSGSWVSSLTRNATGDYTLNIAASVFSSTPVCVVSMESATSSTTGTSSSVVPSSATAASVFLWKTGTGNGYFDGAFHIICMGPR